MADGQTTPGAGASTPTLMDMYQQLNTGMQAATPTIPLQTNDPVKTYQEMMAMVGSGGAPGAAQPYQLAPAINARMPSQPNLLPTSRPTQMPLQGTAQQISQTRTNNMANALGNITSGMANYFAKQRYEQQVNTIKSYTDALQHAQEASNVLANDPNNPQAQQEAAAAQKQLHDLMTGKDAKKNLKILQKAIPNFTNPEENGPEVGAGKAAIQKSQQDAAQGVGDKTLSEKQVGQQSQMLDAKGVSDRPSMGGQPGNIAQMAQQIQSQPTNVRSDALAKYPILSRALANTPMSMQANPAYVMRQAQMEKLQMALINRLMPTMYNVQGREAVQNMKDTTAEYNTNVKAATEQYKLNTENATKLQIASQNNYVKWAGYEARYNSLAGLSAGNPNMTAGAGKAAANIGFQIDKDINMISKTNDQREKDIQTMENQLNADRPMTDSSGKPKLDSKGKPVYMAMEAGPRRDEIEQNIRNLKAQIANDNEHIKNLEDTRNKYSDFATASGAPSQPSGMETLRRQAGLGTDTPTRAADFNPTGGFQQWMPMVEQIRSQQFPNVPPALAQAFLMTENRQGNPNASSRSRSGLQGGQGLFQLIPSNQAKYGISNWSDPADNTTGALNMMSTLMRNNNNDVLKTIKDWAPKDGSDPGYVNRVYNLYQQLQKGGGGTGGGGTTSSAGSSGANQAGGSAVNTQPQSTTGGESTNRFLQQSAQDITGGQQASNTFPSVGPSEDDTGGIDITKE